MKFGRLVLSLLPSLLVEISPLFLGVSSFIRRARVVSSASVFCISHENKKGMKASTFCAPPNNAHERTAISLSDSNTKEDVCKDFTILVCRSTSCTKKRRMLGLDEFHTLSTLYSQQPPCLTPIEIEESPCLGMCDFAPCVAVEHADYTGPVALEGMDSAEFDARVFCSIVTPNDVDRVWSAVDSAIDIMMIQEQETEREV
mmetsp:Transcript_20152/g.28689  ORF Transcript_20152/g.28689 Transcript_20152/m.28689 type:complete len:201 (+) Transcript_20152:138-740(+)